MQQMNRLERRVQTWENNTLRVVPEGKRKMIRARNYLNIYHLIFSTNRLSDRLKQLNVMIDSTLRRTIMGLFSIFKKKSTIKGQETKQTNTQNDIKNIDNKEAVLNLKPITTNNLRTLETSEEYKEKIYDKYYRDFPEKPYISKEQELNINWPESQEMFPRASIIPRTRMTRFSDGLLPGHVYMLYWLKKYTNKSVPVYFEYRYGINFEKEKLFLIDNGYLGTNNKPTALGNKAIQEHNDVIEEHILDSGYNREIQNARKHNPSEEPVEDMVDNNMRGMGFEKEGNIVAAINLYEYNVAHNFDGTHPYERLAIIYRKQKDYANEIRIINSALKTLRPSSPDDWFLKRLERTKELQRKQQQKT